VNAAVRHSLNPDNDMKGLTYVERFAAPGIGLRPTFVGLGTVTADAQHSGYYPLHRHQHYELIVPQRGVYRCMVNEVAWVLPKDSCLLVQPGDRHEDQVAAGGAHSALWFTLAGAPLLAARAEPLIPRSSGLDVALSALFAEPDERDDALAAHVREALAATCVWRLIQAIPLAARSPAFHGESEDDAFRGAIIRLFEQRADQPLTLHDMARDLHLGERTLTSHCRRMLGTTPQQAFLSVRLARARALLTGTTLSVKEVAATCGFADQFHFSRVFKKHYGKSPSQR